MKLAIRGNMWITKLDSDATASDPPQAEGEVLEGHPKTEFDRYDGLPRPSMAEFDGFGKPSYKF